MIAPKTVTETVTETVPALFARLDSLWQSPQHIWAQSQTRCYDIAYLAEHTREKIAFLQAIQAKKCVIYRHSKAQFISDLLACSALGIEVVLPQNGQPESLAALCQSTQADYLLSDVDENAPKISASPTKTTDIPRLKDICLTVYTSGSSGAPKAISKRFSQYLLEVAVQQQQFIEKLGSPCFFSSVSHQHVYGLLFAVLLPLVYRHCLWLDEVRFEERLHYLLKGKDNCVFISSPTFLTRLSQTLPTSPLRLVFSSGGALSTEHAIAVEKRLKTCCIRILGSSETGGIAWQSGDQKHWQTLPSVEVSTDNDLLVVQSPFAYQSPYTSSDRAIMLSANVFKLLGRADDIVKIGEKRVSLTAVGKALEQLAPIVSAKVILLDRPRLCLGAVLVLTADGGRDRAKAPRAFYGDLKKSLGRQFESHAIPRYFRCVAHLPVNAQGKVLYSELKQLFDDLSA